MKIINGELKLVGLLNKTEDILFLFYNNYICESILFYCLLIILIEHLSFNRVESTQ
jgi:hypothetical protein